MRQMGQTQQGLLPRARSTRSLSDRCIRADDEIVLRVLEARSRNDLTTWCNDLMKCAQNRFRFGYTGCFRWIDFNISTESNALTLTSRSLSYIRNFIFWSRPMQRKPTRIYQRRSFDHNCRFHPANTWLKPELSTHVSFEARSRSDAHVSSLSDRLFIIMRFRRKKTALGAVPAHYLWASLRFGCIFLVGLIRERETSERRLLNRP